MTYFAWITHTFTEGKRVSPLFVASVILCKKKF